MSHQVGYKRLNTGTHMQQATWIVLQDFSEENHNMHSGIWSVDQIPLEIEVWPFWQKIISSSIGLKKCLETSIHISGIVMVYYS